MTPSVARFISLTAFGWSAMKFITRLCSFSLRSGTILAPANAPFWTLEEEKFEKERTLTTGQGSTA